LAQSGYYLDGDKVDGTCATVPDSSARTCNGADASGIQTVTCDTGFYESGSAGNDLGCTACATVSDSSARTCNGAGASGIQTVTCDTNFYESGSAGNALSIGDNHQEGVVFHDYGNGSGLIAATTDQSGTAVDWATAKELCANLTIKGYSDWFLPSKGELDEMFTELKNHGVGGFINAQYWSFTEYETDRVWVQDFVNSQQVLGLMTNKYYVRAVRTFHDNALGCTACATVSDASARTCNATGASGIQTVTCDTGFHESGSPGVDLGCTACVNQTHCATSTPNTCSTTAEITTKTQCTSVTDSGYYLDGDKVDTCANQANCTTSDATTCSTTAGITTKAPCTLAQSGYYLDGDKVETCATVPDASARTCNATGASGIQTVTCDTGFHESGSPGVYLGCTACVNQANCTTSDATTCSTTAGITTKAPCTSVTDSGYYLDGDKVDTCAPVSDASARTCNATGASGIQTVTCNEGYREQGSPGVNLVCVNDCKNLADEGTQLDENQCIKLKECFTDCLGVRQCSSEPAECDVYRNKWSNSCTKCF